MTQLRWEKRSAAQGEGPGPAEPDGLGAQLRPLPASHGASAASFSGVSEYFLLPEDRLCQCGFNSQ